MASAQSLLQNLSDHLQEHKAVTYKWFAREYSLPANYAKQLLYQFAEEQGSNIHAVYAVSGLLKAEDDVQQHVVRLVSASQLQICSAQLQEGTVSVHVHSVMPAAESFTPEVVCAEDVEQARHFYEAVTQGAAANNGTADVYARNVCSSISFTANIMTPEERRKRIQDKIRQQKEEQQAAAAAGATNKSGGKARKPAQQPCKQLPGLSPAANAPVTGSGLLSPAPTAKPVLSPIAAAEAQATVPAGGGSTAGGSTSPFVRSPAPSPAAAPLAKAANTTVAGPGKEASTRPAGNGGAAGKGGKQGGLASLWGKAAKAAPKATVQPKAAPGVAPAAAAPEAALVTPAQADVAAPAPAADEDEDVLVGSKRRRGRQLLIEDDDEDDAPMQQQQQQQQPQQQHPQKDEQRQKAQPNGDTSGQQRGKECSAAARQAPSVALPAAQTAAAKTAEAPKAAAADKDASRDAPPPPQQKQQAEKKLQKQGDCDASKDQAATAATASAKQPQPQQRQQQLKGYDAGRKERGEAQQVMSPPVSKAAATSKEGTAPPAVELQTPAAASTPTQPPAKRQKGFAAGFGFSVQAGQPRIDPVTGEEIWGEEEEKPTPKPGFISTPAVVGGGKAAPVFGTKAAARSNSKVVGGAGEDAATGKAAANAAKKKAGAGSKKAAASSNAAQKNIMSFFGK